MNKYQIIFIFSILFLAITPKALSNVGGNEKLCDTIYLLQDDSLKTNQYFVNDSLSEKQKKHAKKKFIVALTAFPFPLGFVGGHRVLLGTKPWVPVVYVATLGGVFGLLPLIDFCVILFSKDIEQYENNPNIFMWVK